MSSRAVASSSTTSTQSLLGGRPPLVVLLAAGSPRPGRRTVKTEPLPGSVAAHHARELARDGKAEACAAVAPRGGAVGLGEFLEQLALLFRRHADAGIGHRKLDPVAAVGDFPDPQLHLALRGELAGIAQEI